MGKKVRKSWFIKGDRYISYFYKKISIRKKKIRIFKIKDRDGIWLEEEDSIKDYFVKEFLNRFKS